MGKIYILNRNLNFMASQKHKADLHYHGPIGFEPYWLRVQGYSGKNLLKLIADTCFKRDITICALTSESDQVNKRGLIYLNSVHDRINYVAQTYINNLNKYYEGYHADKFGNNSIIVEKEDEKGKKTLYLISGQTPIIKEKISGDKIIRFDHLVIGSDQVPNSIDNTSLKTLEDTINYCNDKGLLHGFEHPSLEAHFGIGLERAKEYTNKVDFVEGHNAQIRFGKIWKNVPKIGKYTRENNDKAKAFAMANNLPYVANSDGHMIESAGIAYNEFDANLIDESNEEKLLQTLKSTIRDSNKLREEGKSLTHEGYEDFLNSIESIWKFLIGIRKSKERFRLP